MPAASRQKNAQAVTEPPQDPERWRDIQANVRKMDDLYDATFYSWLRSEDNVLVTASYLQRLAGDYDLERIEHALCWLVADWRLESIAILLRQVTFDWAQKGKQGEKDRARLVLSITENWAIQYVARLVCALLSNATMPLYTSPVLSQDSFSHLHAIPSPHVQPTLTPTGHHPNVSPHTPLSTSPNLLQGRRMAVGNEVAAVAAAAAAASVSAASSHVLVSPTSTSSPSTPTVGSFQQQLPQLLPALTPGSSPTPPSTSSSMATSVISPISASTLSSRSRVQLSTNAGGSMTLPRSARLLSQQRRPSPAQTSLQAVLQHDSQRYPRPPHSPNISSPTAPLPVPSSSAHTGAIQAAPLESQPVVVAPQYTSAFQSSHQRSQTSNGVVNAGPGQHDLSRHSRSNGQGTVYGYGHHHTQSIGTSNTPLIYHHHQQQQQQQQPLHQAHHLQPAYGGHVYGGQQRTYALMEHTPHTSSSPNSVVHPIPSPAVTPVGSRMTSPMTSPISRTGTPYPSVAVAPKPSWSTQQSSANANPVFYVNKPLFMECLAKKWSFCKLSEFFQSLDSTAGITVRLKCSLLKNTALKEEQELQRASTLPSGNNNKTHSNSNSCKTEASSSGSDQESTTAPGHRQRSIDDVSATTSPDQSINMSTDESMMDMDMDHGRESSASSDSVSAPLPSFTHVASGNDIACPTVGLHLPQCPASPTILEEDTVMIEDAPKSESKRGASTELSHAATTDSSSSLINDDHSMMATHRHDSLVQRSSLTTVRSRGISSAPPSRAHTVEASDASHHQSVQVAGFSPLRSEEQTVHPESSPLPQLSSTLEASAVCTTPTPTTSTGSATSRGISSVSAPIIIAAPERGTFDTVAITGNTTDAYRARPRSRADRGQQQTQPQPQQQMNNSVLASPARSLGRHPQVSIHPLDPYAYHSQTSMHPFSHEPETTASMMSQACAALQAKTESSPHEQAWREQQQQMNSGNRQQHQQQRGHSQHSRAQTSDAVLSNTLARAAMVSTNALSTLSLADSRSGAMDDDAVSMTATGASSAMATAATATLGVAAGRRFLNQEQSMSRSLCVESTSGRARRGGDDENGGHGNNSNSPAGVMFGTGGTLHRRHAAAAAAALMMHHSDESDATSSRVTTPSKRKNSLGVTTIQQQLQNSGHEASSSSSSSSLSVSRCSNLFSTFSLTSSPSPLSEGGGAGLSPSSSPSSSSSASPTAAITMGNQVTSAAHFFLSCSSSNATQSLPGTRRTSTCTSTTDEDLKRVRCSRPGSIASSDSTSTISSLASTNSSTMGPSSASSSSSTMASPLSISSSSSTLTITSSSTRHHHATNASGGFSTARF